MNGPFFIARRLFLRQRRDRKQGHPLIGATLGIALSLVPLVAVDHVADAMIEGIIGRYRETSSFHFQIHSWSTPDRVEWESALQVSQDSEAVESSWIERQGFALARAEGAREGLTIRALPPTLYEENPDFARYIEFDSGSWNLDDGQSILLGREAARKLNAETGDILRVLTARRLPDGRYVPKVTRLTVGGIFSSGYQDLDRTWAFVSLETGWTILSPESSRTFIGGRFADPDAEPETNRMALAADLEDRWTVYHWRELNRYLLSNLESTRTILLFLMGIIIAVAVVNVFTSLVMLTLERRREIGILKCTGTSPNQITRTFLIAGALASAVGTVIGLGGGLLVSRYVNEIISGIEVVLGLFSPRGGVGPNLLDEGYYLQYIPIHLRWRATAIIGLATFLLSVLASAIPAARAAGLKPLEVLRKH